MASGFFCLEGCANPECGGCDITKISTEQLDQLIWSSESGLDKLVAERHRREDLRNNLPQDP